MKGQVETLLDDGRRLFSATRKVEDGARAVLFLDPGVVRVDAVPHPDMFRVLVRALDPAVPVVHEAGARPRTVLSASGVAELDLPLLGSAAMTLRTEDGRTWELTVATLRDPDTGTTRLTAQVVLSTGK